MEFTIKPIGYIKSTYKNVKDIPAQGVFSDTVAEIIIQDEFVDGITGISDLRHIVILFSFHKSIDYRLVQHPRGDKNNPKIGVFATRSPFRPNGIGMSIVKVLQVSNNIIKFECADMLDGTPVIDIKPYVKRLNPEGE